MNKTQFRPIVETPTQFFQPPPPSQHQHQHQHQSLGYRQLLPANANVQNQSPYSLRIVHQTCSSQESIPVGNDSYTFVHVVVKNSPFTLQIAWNHDIPSQDTMIDLTRCTFDAILLYDTGINEVPYGNSVVPPVPIPSLVPSHVPAPIPNHGIANASEKQVDYVKVKPIEFKVSTLTSRNHKTMTTDNLLNFELRIKVLTSQHENSFFRVKIVVLDPSSGLPLHPSLFVLSEPIKVISKLEQMKKKLPNSKKRTINDELDDALARLEEQTREQQALINSLLEKQQQQQQIQQKLTQQIHDAKQREFKRMKIERNQASSISLTKSTASLFFLKSSSSCLGVSLAAPPPPPPLPPAEAVDFDTSFKRFFDKFKNLAIQERADRVNRLFRNPSTQHQEFFDLLYSELQSHIPPNNFLGHCPTTNQLPPNPNENFITTPNNLTGNNMIIINNNNNNNNINILTKSTDCTNDWFLTMKDPTSFFFPEQQIYTQIPQQYPIIGGGDPNQRDFFDEFW